MPENTVPIPLILLTGFLGSGKTTLLNGLLRHPEFGGTAVLVNEIGTIGIDHNLVVGASDDILLLEGGCVCCQPKGSVSEGVSQLLMLDPPPKRIVIETSGAANPYPVLESLSQHPLASTSFQFPRVATVVDCLHGKTTLAQHLEARFQLSAADVVVLSKADLASTADRLAINETVAQSNPAAMCLTGSGGVLPGELAKELLRPGGLSDSRHDESSSPIEHVHGDKEFETVGLQFDGYLEAAAVQDWIDEVLELYGSNILRIKGILRLKDFEQPAVLQCVRDMVHPLELLDAESNPISHNNIVAIGWDMHRELLAEALGWLAERSEQGSSK